MGNALIRIPIETLKETIKTFACLYNSECFLHANDPFFCDQLIFYEDICGINLDVCMLANCSCCFCHPTG